MEFSGCVYADPKACAEEKEWRVDESSGVRFPFDLTRDELAGMNLVDLPMRIEHTENDKVYKNEVGRVVDVARDPSTGYTAVKWRLHDNAAGLTAKTLTEKGTIRELSLGHEYDASTGRVTPKEISLCFKGARKDTGIYRNLDTFENVKKGCAVRTSNMSAEQLPVEEKVAPAAEEKAPAAEAPAAEAPSKAAEEPVAVEQPVSHESFLEKISGALSNADPALQKELWDRYGGLMKESIQMREQVNKLEESNKLLKETNDKISENHKVTAEQMIKVMDDLYKKFAPTVQLSDETRKEATKELSQNPNLLEVLRSVPVMASAIQQRDVQSVKSTVDVTKHNEALQKGLAESRAAVAYYEKTLSGMHSEPPKIWEAPKEAPVAVAVNASGSKKRAASVVPDWLRAEAGRYDDAAFGGQKIYKNDYNHPERLSRNVA